MTLLLASGGSPAAVTDGPDDPQPAPAGGGPPIGTPSVTRFRSPTRA
jgi:hypothetical protein